MAVHLVTGYAGKGHITSADEGCFNAGLCGLEKYVLETGEQFKYTLDSNNQITIASGDLVNQGRHFSIPYGTAETLTIENGTQGYSRIDVVVMRYERAAGTGIETPVLKIVKGTPRETAPSVPALETGNIFSGDSVDEMPLYYIYIKDLNVTEVEKVFTVIPPLADIQNSILNILKIIQPIDGMKDNISKMWETIYPIGSIYLTVNSVSPAVLFGGTWEKISNRFLFGSGNKQNGATGGEEYHTLSVSEIPSHTHYVNAHSHKVPKHKHSAKISSSGNHTHEVNRSLAAASGTAKCAAQYNATTKLTHSTSSNGAHTHEITINDCNELTTGSSGSGNTNAAGGSQKHNNMPPYLVVNIWKRTA